MTTSKKNGRRPQKNKMEDDVKKIKMEKTIKKNLKKTRLTSSKKMEDDLKKRKKRKTTKKNKKIEDDLKKMEYKPINQKQPNWL